MSTLVDHKLLKNKDHAICISIYPGSSTVLDTQAWKTFAPFQTEPGWPTHTIFAD